MMGRRDFHFSIFPGFYISLNNAQCLGRSVWLCVVITWNAAGAAGQSGQATTRGTLLYSLYSGLELQMTLRESWAFSWLKAPSSAFAFKTLW